MFYSGMGYVLSEFRGSGNIPAFWSSGAQWAKKTNSIFSFMGTFPGFEAKVHTTNPGKFSSLTNIPFRSLNFNPHSSNEKSVFEGIISGMNLMATI